MTIRTEHIRRFSDISYRGSSDILGDHEIARNASESLRLSISVRWITQLLALAIGVLVAGNTISLYCRYAVGPSFATSVVSLFDLGNEFGLGTHFSALCLVASSVLLLMIARIEKGRPGARHWFALGVIFLFLSFDEACMLHERSIGPVMDLYRFSGAFYHAWVVPYGILLIIFAMSYYQFLKRLPRWIARGLIIAGGIYVGGALGMELVSGLILSSTILETYPMAEAVSYSIEETCEMIGILLLIRLLLRVIAARIREVHLTIFDSST